MRLVFGTLSAFLAILGTWLVYDYVTSAPQRADAKVQAGMQLLTPGRYDQAVAQFNRALEIDPNSWSAYYRRGVAKQNMGAREDALADFQAALELKPDLLDARIARAGIYSEKGDWANSITELTKVIEISPSVDAHFRRGNALAELGQHPQAIEDFSWITEHVRDAPFAYLARAKSKRALGDVAGAALDEQAVSRFNRVAK
jgi:tetratricopeptide (TPR) repeat protein